MTPMRIGGCAAPILVSRTPLHPGVLKPAFSDAANHTRFRIAGQRGGRTLPRTR